MSRIKVMQEESKARSESRTKAADARAKAKARKEAREEAAAAKPPIFGQIEAYHLGFNDGMSVSKPPGARSVSKPPGARK